MVIAWLCLEVQTVLITCLALDDDRVSRGQLGIEGDDVGICEHRAAPIVILKISHVMSDCRIE